MKVILSVSIGMMIYFGVDSGLLNQVDYKGIYRSTINSSKIIRNQIELKANGTFEYQIIFQEGLLSQQKIRGNYTVKGKKLRLFPFAFENYPTHSIKNLEHSKINTRGIQSPSLINKKSPDYFKRYLASFESGNASLKPMYIIKQLKTKLSLCHLDLKTEQYQPDFLIEK